MLWIATIGAVVAVFEIWSLDKRVRALAQQNERLYERLNQVHSALEREIYAVRIAMDEIANPTDASSDTPADET